MPPTKFAHAFGFVLLFTGFWASAREALREPFGTFVGVQTEVAANGGDESASAGSLVIDERGVSLGVGHDAGGRPWVIRYPSLWLVTTTTAGGFKRIAVRQSALGSAFAFALVFDEAKSGRVVRAIRPDGEIIAEFFRTDAETSNAQIARARARLHRRHYRAHPLVGINAATDLMHQGADQTLAKVAWLDRMKTEYRDFDAAHVEYVLPLLSRGLKNSDPRVRVAALRVFARAPRAVAVRPLLLLARRRGLDGETVDHLVRTLGYYLGEANRILADRRRLRDRFHTEDPSVVSERLGGIVQINDTVGLTAITLDRAHNRAWTRAHASQLRSALITFTRRAPTPELRALAEQTLEAWEPSCTSQLDDHVGDSSRIY